MFLSKIRLPSRGQLVFGITVASIGGALYRDHYYSDSIRKRQIKEASQLALQTIPVTELPRKIYVYIAADHLNPEETQTHKLRKYFIEYVKPIWDAAAIDYEVISSKDEGMVAKEIMKKIKQLRQEKGWWKPETFPDNEETPGIVKRPWGLDGVVVVGNTTLGETLEGIHMGFGLSEIRSEWSTSSIASTEEADLANLDSEKMYPIPEATSQELSQLLPPLGYIPYRWLSGWSTLPLRFLSWFNDHELVEEIGNMALGIALDKKRICSQKDLEQSKYLKKPDMVDSDRFITSLYWYDSHSSC